MLLSTQTNVVFKNFGEEQGIRMLVQAGFDAFDWSLYSMFRDKDGIMNTPHFREYAKNLRALADSYGIVCNQAHAPFDSSVGNPERDEEIFQMIVRSMESAAIVGAKIIIVHPKHHLPYMTYAAELKKMNMEFYRRLIPYCEEFGIQIACENMWKYSSKSGHTVDSVCSRPEEFCDYLDTLDSPWIVGCLDVGHVELTDEDLTIVVRALGNKRLRALHVHDNDCKKDWHTLPFVGDICFDKLTSALAEIGYDGDFTFEADRFLDRFPKELQEDALRLMCHTGRYLMSQIKL